MSTFVIYGATSADQTELSGFKNVNIIFEKSNLQDAAVVRDADYIALFADSIFRSEHITPRLKAIINRAAGVDNIQCPDLEKKGISLIRNVDYSTKAVAEYSLTHILHDAHQYYWRRPVSSSRVEIGSLKVAIIGLGRVGLHLKGILEAIGCEVTTITRTNNQLEVALDDADIVCIHASLNEMNRHMIDRSFFIYIKQGTLFINAGRGELVDNQALYEAVLSGKVRKAILDVLEFDEEAYAEKLLTMKEVTYTSHTAWRTPSSTNRSMEFLKRQIRLLN